MATEPSPQRAYRAACPNCGAPVDFRSAASASAVCSFCRSTLVRDGDALRRIGTVAELFEDHSPLQLGADGRLQSVAFTLVGRLQYGYEGGTWNEWHVLFDNGRSGWLSEDNGAYVIGFDAALKGAAPDPQALHAGARVQVDGAAWDVASVTTAHLVAAQGELPFAPRLQGDFIVADLRNALGEVGTLDYTEPKQPHWSLGRALALSDLALKGLREDSEKTLGARAFTCPSCGASLQAQLASTLSLTCPQCRAVVDVSQGAGADLAHYAQSATARPAIELGRVGRLSLGPEGELGWQVVGWMERRDIPEDADEPPTTWNEYLLYHRTAGFAFLVDAEDGWSAVRPLTGAPQQKGDRAVWQGDVYTRSYRYGARVTAVQGEFYWRVRRDEIATVTDYVGVGTASRKRLSREETAAEVTWSGGEVLDFALVARAFGLPGDGGAGLPGDVSPLSSTGTRSALGLRTIVVVVVVVLLLVLLLSRCSRDDCDSVRKTFGAASAEYQQCLRQAGSGGAGRIGGGSFGGYSSGGGHK